MTRQVWRLAWVACLPGIALGACGGDGIPLSQFGTRLLDVQCNVGVHCGQYPDKATCLMSGRPSNLDQLMASVAAGKTKYDSHAAASCLEAFGSNQSFGSCSQSIGLNPAPLHACEATFTGTIGAGAPCLIDEECVSAQCDKTNCTGDLRCCPGLCTAPVHPIAMGGDCSLFGTDCVEGAYCKDVPGSTPICTAKIADGQPCDGLNGPRQCVVGTVCRFSEPPGPTGICAKLPGEGQPCLPVGPACDSTLDVCSVGNGPVICVRRAAVGAVCSSSLACVAYATCDPAAQTCVARIGAGGACDAQSGAPSCQGSLQCTSSICTLPPANPVCP